MIPNRAAALADHGPFGGPLGRSSFEASKLLLESLKLSAIGGGRQFGGGPATRSAQEAERGFADKERVFSGAKAMLAVIL